MYHKNQKVKHYRLEYRPLLKTKNAYHTVFTS